jgi:hypothetical protein
MPQDAPKPDDEARDLSPDELDDVAGGALHTDFEPGSVVSPDGAVQKGGTAAVLSNVC